jgi:hypothetical protein
MTFVCTDEGRHAVISDSHNGATSPRRQQLEKLTRDLFLTFHCYCTRKDVGFSIAHYFAFMQCENILQYHAYKMSFFFISVHDTGFFFISNSLLFCLHVQNLYQIHCLDVLLEDTDVGKALTEYVSYAAIENLILGAPRHGFIR